jgi:hypothetical protein
MRERPEGTNTRAGRRDQKGLANITRERVGRRSFAT